MNSNESDILPPEPNLNHIPVYMCVAAEPSCMPAFDTTGRYLTINGARKKSSWRVKDFPLVSADPLGDAQAPNTRVMHGP